MSTFFRDSEDSKSEKIGKDHFSFFCFSFVINIQIISRPSFECRRVNHHQCLAVDSNAKENGLGNGMYSADLFLVSTQALCDMAEI